MSFVIANWELTRNRALSYVGILDLRNRNTYYGDV
jgi:hypothetical protein